MSDTLSVAAEPDALSRASFHAARHLLAGTPLRPFAPILGKWFSDDLKRIYGGLPGRPDGFFAELLHRLNIQVACSSEDLRRLPASGPVIVIANHPFGLAEGIVMGDLLSRVRPDFRFLANSLLAEVPPLREYVLPVNPFGGSAAVLQNRQSLRRSMEWLRDGGMLVVFPAGEVATMRFPEFDISDRQWTENVVRLMRRTQAPAVPVFFHGVNSAAFHLAGLVHPQMRTMLLPRELLNKAGSRMEISIGSLIPAQRLEEISGARAATEYLRSRTFALGARTQPRQTSREQRTPIAPPQDSMRLAQELARLPESQHLLQHHEFDVYWAGAAQIPALLCEIGRLREITFRHVGEGTGGARDLDAFDSHYEHLILWHRANREIAGAYRIAKTDEVVRQRGPGGLYTSTLFHLRRDFYQQIQPALELGRSFVRVEYQKSYSALLMLWKGIGHYVAANPRYRILFGPVSISKNYSPASRALMVEYLTSRHGNQRLSKQVEPRRKFKTRPLVDCDPRNFSTLLSSVDELSEIVADMELDHKRIPVLLQQYLNLGGEILVFNVDRTFSDVLDGLVVVDLTKTSRRQVERYMGKENASKYLALHA